MVALAMGSKKVLGLIIFAIVLTQVDARKIPRQVSHPSRNPCGKFDNKCYWNPNGCCPFKEDPCKGYENRCHWLPGGCCPFKKDPCNGYDNRCYWLPDGCCPNKQADYTRYPTSTKQPSGWLTPGPEQEELEELDP